MEIMSNQWIIIFVFTMLLSGYIRSSAINELSVKEIEKLEENNINTKIVFFPILLIIGATYGITTTFELNKIIYFLFFLSSMFFYIYLVLYIYTYKNLIKLDLPTKYIKKHIISVLILFLGALVLIYPVIINPYLE